MANPITAFVKANKHRSLRLCAVLLNEDGCGIDKKTQRR